MHSYTKGLVRLRPHSNEATADENKLQPEVRMNASHLNLSTCEDLSQVASGGHIHLIGVCGIAMGALAIALAEMGYAVSGSDKEFYPPMSSLLNQSQVKIFKGFSKANIPDDVDLCIIGNAVPATNEEVRTVEEKKLPHTFFAKIAGELIQGDKTGIVVAGTHGKTTTTALLAYAFTQLQRDPSYFIGGDIPQLSSSFVYGRGGEGIIEGDEYDSVFYVKRPKFLFYKPDILILNSLEFDHADIYESLDQIEEEFIELIRRVPLSGYIIACTDYSRIKEIIKSVPRERLITFGRSIGADYRLSKCSYDGDLQVGTIEGPESSFELRTPLVGQMNMLNCLAGFLATKPLGITLKDWQVSIKDFIGVTRRLQQHYCSSSAILLEDFAHHPTAVREVIQAVKARYPDSPLWVAFEPRSNTSRRAIFQKEYEESFSGVARLFLREIQSRYTDQNEAMLDLLKVKSSIEQEGGICEMYADGHTIQEAILQHLQVYHRQHAGNSAPVVIVVMSNGSFDGLSGNLTRLLKDSE